MNEPSQPPKRSRMDQARGLVRGAQNVYFYILSCGVGAFGVYFAWLALQEVLAGELFVGFVLILLSIIPISLPIVVFRERRRDKALTRFLVENVANLEKGATGPDGVTYTLDTVLVSYETRFSAVVVALKFTSGLYLHGPSHRLPKLLYTLFTTVFGWWVFDLEVFIDNLAIIGRNIADSNQVTVAQLLGFEEPATEEGEPLDPDRLPD